MPRDNRVISATAGSLAIVGGITLSVLELVGGVSILLRDAAGKLPALFRGRSRRQAWRNVWTQLDRVGVKAIPIVSLVVFCVGMIISLQVSPILKTFGASREIADVIGIAILRELGPLIGAIVLTGFAGASIAAELGTMVVGEEVIALRTHAIHPVRFLVVPRVLATIVMTACLAVLADVMGVLGGMFAANLVLDIPYAAFLRDCFDAATTTDFVTGIVKASVFGGLIGGLACYQGLTVEGGAEGVGAATTRTVVFTIVGLIVIDLMFTAVFFTFNV